MFELHMKKDYNFEEMTPSPTDTDYEKGYIVARNEMVYAHNAVLENALAAQRESFKNTTAMASESIEDWKQEGREELRSELAKKICLIDIEDFRLFETAPSQYYEGLIVMKNAVLSLLTPSTN